MRRMFFVFKRCLKRAPMTKAQADMIASIKFPCC